MRKPDLQPNVYTENQTSGVPQQMKSIKNTPQKIKSSKKGSAKRLVVVLLLLSVIPLSAGAFRLTTLAIGVEITPDNARFIESPLPVVLHILSASVYTVLGTFQFAPGFRLCSPGWHRVAGMLLVLCGLLVGLTGLWMTLFYSIPYGGKLLYFMRLLFSSAMIYSILHGFTTIFRGDIDRHGAWMTRAYAIGLGAGTQAITEMAWTLIFGPPDELAKALLMGTGWAINLTLAEWAIRKKPASPVT